MTRPDPLCELLDLLADTLGGTVFAALDGDRMAAKSALHTGARRHRLTQEAALLRPAASPLVDDLHHLSELVDDLARLVAVGRVRGVAPEHEEALVLLARYGRTRLRELADSPCLGPEQLRTGRCLHDVLVALDTDGERDAVGVTCSALATTLLRASRHAARAA